MTATYRILNTEMPTVSAARGCSPTERKRRPNGVRNTKMYVPTSSANDTQIIRLSWPMIGPMKYQCCTNGMWMSGIP